MALHASLARAGTVALLVAATVARAGAAPKDVLSDLPKAPTTPPALARRMPLQEPHCQRIFIYQGRNMSCDSYVQADGEQLRPILTKVPEAESRLNEYQATRRSVQNWAYVASAGLAVLIGSLYVGPNLTDSGGGISSTGRTVRNVGGVIGLAVFGFSLGYGFIRLADNEARLGEAVETYNAAYPTDPIQLQFTAGITF